MYYPTLLARGSSVTSKGNCPAIPASAGIQCFSSNGARNPSHWCLSALRFSSLRSGLRRYDETFRFDA